MSLLIGSGFTYRPGAAKAESFFALWLANIHRFAKPQPERIVVVCVGGAVPAVITDDVDVIQLAGNLGHGNQLVGVEKPVKPHAHSGWTAAFMVGAWAAYAAETDFLWQESDCLGFGNYVGEMYREMGTADCVFGGKMKSAPFMSSHQSLVLIRHDAIPLFTRAYLSFGDERDKGRLVEHHFDYLRNSSLDARRLKCAFLSPVFVDRMRPIPFDEPVFSAQQWSDLELSELKKRGLV